MPTEISLLTEADIPAAVSAVQEAFADDPYYNWVFDTAKFDKRRNTASVGIRCRSGIRQGLYYIAKDGETGKTLGVSMWLPPRPTDRPQSWSSWLDDWRVWLEQVGMNLWYGRGGLNLKRYWIWRKAQAQAHEEIWTDPRGYYFLNIMVVTSEARGRGIGRRLVAAVTDRADREGMPCYLESSKAAPNIQIYERLGFRLAGDIVCEDEDEDGGGESSVKLYCMIRDPQPQVSSLARGKEEDLHQA